MGLGLVALFGVVLGGEGLVWAALIAAFLTALFLIDGLSSLSEWGSILIEGPRTWSAVAGRSTFIPLSLSSSTEVRGLSLEVQGRAEQSIQSLGAGKAVTARVRALFSHRGGDQQLALRLTRRAPFGLLQIARTYELNCSLRVLPSSRIPSELMAFARSHEAGQLEELSQAPFGAQRGSEPVPYRQGESPRGVLWKRSLMRPSWIKRGPVAEAPPRMRVILCLERGTRPEDKRSFEEAVRVSAGCLGQLAQWGHPVCLSLEGSPAPEVAGVQAGLNALAKCRPQEAETRRSATDPQGAQQGRHTVRNEQQARTIFVHAVGQGALSPWQTHADLVLPATVLTHLGSRLERSERQPLEVSQPRRLVPWILAAATFLALILFTRRPSGLHALGLLTLACVWLWRLSSTGTLTSPERRARLGPVTSALLAALALSPLYDVFLGGTHSVITRQSASLSSRDESQEAQAEGELESPHFDGSMPLGSGPSPGVRALVVEVTSEAPLPEYMYLAGLYPDSFTLKGMQLSETRPPPEAQLSDAGWLVLESDELKPRAGSSTNLTVRQRPITGLGSPGLVLTPPGARRIRSRTEGLRLLHAPEGPLLARDFAPSSRWLSFEVVHAPRISDNLHTARAQHTDGTFTSLPPDQRLVQLYTAYARDLTRGANTDLERVQRILDHLRSAFRYDLEPGAEPSLAGLAEFLDRRTGYCTWFASAAVLLLRTEGLAARACTGFLAARESASDDFLRAGTINAHAWIEVYFEGHGWRTFDPTPAAGGANLLGEFTPLGELRFEWDSLLSSGLDGGSLGRLARSALNVPLQAARSHPRRAGALTALLFGLGLSWLGLRRSRRRSEPELPSHRAHSIQDLDHVRALEQGLARAGWVRRPNQSLSRVVAQAGQQWPQALGQKLQQVCSALERARFGATPLDAEGEEQMLAWLAELDTHTQKYGSRYTT